MRKKIMKLCVALSILCGVVFFANANVQAKTQNYYVKGSTLTVTGKLTDKTKIKGAGKIKKIVVKKNVAILPTKPFEKCKKVKTLEVPGNLIFLNPVGCHKSDRSYCRHYFPITVKTVKFTTQMASKTMYKYYLTGKYIVSKKDKKFKSYNGNIYTKNGKQFIAMPSECKTLKIRKGCKTVDVDGFSYESFYGDSCSDDPDNYIVTSCRKLKKVIIPSTVKKYVGAPREDMNKYITIVARRAEYVISNKKFSYTSMQVWYDVLRDRILEVFKDEIEKKGDFYIYNKNILVGYDGCQAVVNIPEGIEHSIEQGLGEGESYDGNSANYEMISKVNLPSTFKDKKSKIWSNDSIILRQYNKDEIVVGGPDGSTPTCEYCWYCKHYKNKSIKITLNVNGTLSFIAKGAKVTDKDGNEIQGSSGGRFAVDLKKGESVSVQIPDDFKDGEFYAVYNIQYKLK